MLIMIGIMVNLTWFDKSKLEEPASRLTAAQLEARYGIQVDMISVSDDGLVNFHFKVVNADKARSLFQDAGKRPVLTVTGSGLWLRAAPEAVKTLELREGAVTYISYKNFSGLIKPGTPVVVIVDIYMLGPIEAK
jgi:hypothetical protein